MPYYAITNSVDYKNGGENYHKFDFQEKEDILFFLEEYQKSNCFREKITITKNGEKFNVIPIYSKREDFFELMFHELGKDEIVKETLRKFDKLYERDEYDEYDFTDEDYQLYIELTKLYDENITKETEEYKDQIENFEQYTEELNEYNLELEKFKKQNGKYLNDEGDVDFEKMRKALSNWKENKELIRRHLYKRYYNEIVPHRDHYKKMIKHFDLDLKLDRYIELYDPNNITIMNKIKSDISILVDLFDEDIEYLKKLMKDIEQTLSSIKHLKKYILEHEIFPNLYATYDDIVEEREMFFGKKETYVEPSEKEKSMKTYLPPSKKGISLGRRCVKKKSKPKNLKRYDSTIENEELIVSGLYEVSDFINHFLETSRSFSLRAPYYDGSYDYHNIEISFTDTFNGDWYEVVDRYGNPYESDEESDKSEEESTN